MPEAPVAPAPAAPAAPAPAPSAPAAASPTPAAPAAPATTTPSAPEAAAPSAPAAPAKFDPKTAAAPPKSTDYTNDAEGMRQFITDNTTWSQEHPEEAEKIRTAKIAAEDGSEPAAIAPEATVAAEVKAAEGEVQPDAAKPADAPAVAATPAAIEEWTSKSPELKAAFEKSPELKAQVMEMARGLEAASKVTEIVGTPEEAQFAVDHAQRLVSLQTNWMLSGEDPEMIQPAWDQTVEMFKERDANGAEIKGPDGKPKLGSDFKPFVRKAAATAIEEIAAVDDAQIAAIQSRLNGHYPNEEAKALDEEALRQATYNKAANEYMIERLKGADDAAKLPSLPPNATAEQIAFQKQLEQQSKELEAKGGKATTDSRKAATKALNNEVQQAYETGLNTFIETNINAMKERGEYLPDFVLNDKWINPTTGKVTGLSSFGVKIYLALNDKINKNPLHAAKLASLEALGAGGKESRLAEIKRLQNLYLPKIFQAEVKRIQDGIRGAARPKPPGTVSADGKDAAGAPRLEPRSQGTVAPSAVDARSWAETEAKKDPNYAAMSANDREALTISLAMKKKFGG